MADININQLFEKLEDLYLQSKYQEARNLLLQNKHSLDEGQFHYNYGTLSVKMNDHAVGRYHLEKAVKKNFINSKVFHNLGVTKEFLSVKEMSSSSSWWDRSMDGMLSLPESSYLSATLVIFILILVLVRKKVIKRIAVFIIASLVAITPFAFSKLYLQRVSFAIALKDVTLREGPSQIYPELLTIKSGSKFIVGEKHEEWFFVKNPKESIGWVNKKDIAFY